MDRMSSSLSLERDGAVALLRIDVPHSPLNVLSAGLFDELESLLEEIEAADEIEAVVLASGKPGTFIAGADLHALAAIREAAEAEALSRRAHELLDRIAGSPKPFVAAIDGAALGGGLEIALACHRRIASDAPRTVLALPEVTLGLIPGAGGTQRLPRLVGIVAALGMLLTGARMRARRALEIGLVDRVVEPEELLEVAKQVAGSLATEWRRPRGWSPASWSSRLRWAVPSRSAVGDRLFRTAPFRSLILRRAARSVRRKTRGLYPAPFAILDAVRRGLAGGFRKGQQAEIAAFGRLLVSPQAANLIRLFELTSARKKTSGDLAPFRSIGVVGAGLMGEGIASVTLDRHPVVLEDLDPERLRKARASIGRSLEKRANAGALTSDEAAERASRLVTSSALDDLAGCDLVIEAVFEDLSLKRELFRELEDLVGEDAVLASNTSALPIARIAEGLRRPERAIGMHYFSPVPKMPLLEIVAPAAASPRAVERARAFGIAQGKVPIVVGDGPGFYTTRVLAPLLNEAMLLLEEGAPPALVESSLRDFGFPVGPLTLLDEVGIDVAAHVSRDLGEAFAAAGHRPSAALEQLVAAGTLGRKAGRGFFVYRDGKKKGLDEEVLRMIAPDGSRGAPDGIVDRMVLAFVNEAARALDEGILRSEEDGDLGAVLGLGFPPFRGGPFTWARTEGKANAGGRLRSLAQQHGPRFQPAKWFDSDQSA